jgi:hypothetical protein
MASDFFSAGFECSAHVANRPIMRIGSDHRHAGEYDQDPRGKANVPKESVDHNATPLLKQPIDIPRTATRVEKWSAAMRAILLIALILLPTAALAQGAPAKRPAVGGKPHVQAKPSAPAGCKFVGTVKGTKLWAGDCTASELKTTMPAEETSKPQPDQPVGAIPKGQQ